LGNVLLHIPVGIFNVYVWYKAQSLALLFGVSFIIYQILERQIIHDKAYPEIQGWLWGIAIAIVGWEIINFIW